MMRLGVASRTRDAAPSLLGGRARFLAPRFAVYEDDPDPPRRQTRKATGNESEGERNLAVSAVVHQVAGPGGRIVRHQQVLAIGIQSKILFLRPRGPAPQTLKDLMGLCLAFHRRSPKIQLNDSVSITIAVKRGANGFQDQGRGDRFQQPANHEAHRQVTPVTGQFHNCTQALGRQKGSVDKVQSGTAREPGGSSLSDDPQWDIR
ncbi:hypothetical protein WN55_05373 [Dufourea novaeangliae]|uniref:Uncharacterized protein n=1 Tax=Dufourea novaeangliae TaxID=178035 RepID=A0A154PMM8_DUFNO|nr:hypothetical protein WN55_05373 [Dufourea novaeangliae]